MCMITIPHAASVQQYKQQVTFQQPFKVTSKVMLPNNFQTRALGVPFNLFYYKQ